MEQRNKSDKPAIAFFLSLAIVSSVFIVAYTHYSIEERKLMSESIQKSIEKDINPLAIRCSYAPPTDTICIAYGSSINRQQNANSPQVQVQPLSGVNKK